MPYTPPNPSPFNNTWGTGGAGGNRQLAGQQVYGGWGQQLANPGYDAATKNAIEQEGMNATRASFAGTQADIARRAISSGNSSGVAPALAMSGRQEASAFGQQARQNKILEAQEAQRQKETALGGMGDLYGGETGYMENLLAGRAAAAGKPIATYGNTTGTGRTSGGNWKI